jgi:Interferon-induced transmembrane protein
MTYPPPPPPPPSGPPPYGQPPYGQPPYGAPQGGYPAQQPDSNLVWGILCALLCCLPLGVVSIVYSSRVSGLSTQGRYAEAQAASDSAKKWAIWGAVAGVIVLIIYGIIAVAGGMSSYM